MKICLVSKEVGTIRGVGAGGYVTEAGKALAEAGHEVWLLTRDGGGGRREILEEKFGFHKVVYAGEGLKPGRAPEFLQGNPHYAYSDLVHSTLMALDVSFDYIEFPDFEAEGIVAIREAKLMGGYRETLLGLTLHSPTFEFLKHQGQLHRLTYDLKHTIDMEDYVVRNCTFRLSPNEALLEEVAGRLSLPEPPGSILPFPKEFPSEIPGPPLPGRRLEDLSFLFFGGIEPRKGILQLIHAFSDLPGLTLKVLGRDSNYDPFGRSFRDYIREKAPKNVVFLDPPPGETILDLLKEADVCLLPSLWEGFPLACAEAMGQARVVVAGRAGGVSDWISHGENGFLVDASDPGEISRCIREDVGRNLDRLDEIGRNAAQRVRKATDPRSYAAKLESLVQARSEGLAGGSRGKRCGGKVTVVIPFYGGKETIGEAVDSALGQTYGDVEVLVVDDGSPFPESEGVLAGLVEKDPRIRVVRKENGGLGSARNRGIEEASGEYLIFLDDDDVIFPRYAEWGVAAMERRPELGFLVPYTRFNDVSGNKPPLCFNPMSFNWSTALVINQFGTAGAFFRKKVFLEKNIKYDEELISYEDWALWMDLAKVGVEGDVLPRICYDYRIREGSMMDSRGWPNHSALVGLLINRHFPVSGERERELLTVLNQAWGEVATAARFGKAVVKEEEDCSPIPIRPAPLAPPPLRYKVADFLAPKVGRIPFLSRTLRKVLKVAGWVLDRGR